MVQVIRMRAPAGASQMSIGDVVYDVEQDGHVDVLSHHVEHAKSHGYETARDVEAREQEEGRKAEARRAELLEAAKALYANDPAFAEVVKAAIKSDKKGGDKKPD